ncbi:hypothetical protein QTP70_007095 [Hemibagrus guttatus]|uniref:Reverse transcriptase domain-containing protein n=1 Tax=Hemibagrus guttatus TaxID=175788 RepID=A0AAE0RJ79_9TELE|nr:hypothetical protein QTP70_007095 [Hemibagrus guttatus]KAK3574296.1 hypothetical protein QTP86_004357 [Hemibagrus guttatus]
MKGKGRELADVMERRKVDILCVQETRWKGSKARSIGAGFKLFYYGVDSKRNGVGVVLKEEFVRNVLEVKRVSDRVMLNVVSGYAPQVGCELGEKERFWSELDEVMENIPTGERVVIGADFNGHVGEGNKGDEEEMGKFGVKERNLEGEMVVDFAKWMDMAVVNTYFQKREEHRVTYKSGDLEKAYDRVPREELWYCMRKSGVAEKYVRVVQDMYERSRTVVRCAVGQTEEFNVEVGLHQGSALNPFLFAIVMDQLSKEIRQESPWTMMFADDIVIRSESREQVEENLERWRFALERRGMKVSRSDEEVMGKFGVQERKFEGKMVVDFAKWMDMAVVNTYFQKREEHTAEVIRVTGRKVLGVSSGRRKEDLVETWWWNEEVQDSIQRKRLAKKKWDIDRIEENRQEYKELQRRVKREVSKTQQKAYVELYTRLDTRAGPKDLCRLARQRDRDGKDVQQVRAIKDRDGRVLTSEESVQRRWKEYFEELMNEINEREKRSRRGQTEELEVEVGLDQGSALCPFLFAMVMDQLSEEVRQDSPCTMMFADDIVICSESREQVEVCTGEKNENANDSIKMANKDGKSGNPCLETLCNMELCDISPLVITMAFGNV